MSPAGGPGPHLDVVVPTVDEERHLPRLLRDLDELRVDHRVTVVDGGSGDGTVDAARRMGVRVVRAPRGRAVQMAVGAAASTAPWLFFVHADCRLPGAARHRVEEWLVEATPRDAAHLAFALDGDGWFWRFIELGQALRERATGLVYGDQGLLLSRSLYAAVGGFPDLPIMEDVVMVDRVRRRGRLHRLDAPLPASPRRYRAEGPWRTWLRHTGLITLFRLGVPPHRLAPRSTTRPDRPGATAHALLVFAKAPRPGRVKTRLAAHLGPEAATELYRRMARGIVDAVRPGPWRTRVLFTPSDARSEVTSWLGPEPPELTAQVDGDLGVRMEEAIRTAFGEADRVCVVGTDAPGVDRGRVADAFQRLDEHDLVVGPARDGGYYLLGLRRPAPALFRDIPWSTPTVLERTLQRAAAAGLSVDLLPELVDVDTWDDLVMEPTAKPGAGP